MYDRRWVVPVVDCGRRSRLMVVVLGSSGLPYVAAVLAGGGARTGLWQGRWLCRCVNICLRYKIINFKLLNYVILKENNLNIMAVPHGVIFSRMFLTLFFSMAFDRCVDRYDGLRSDSCTPSVQLLLFMMV